MFEKSLKHLRKTHPEESGILEDLDKLEAKLNSLISEQQNCLLYDPKCINSNVRIQIYNTYSDQDPKPVNYLFTHVPPSTYTLYIKAYELDNNKNIIENQESHVLSKFFRLIMFDTPSGVIVWDRDELEAQTKLYFHTDRHQSINEAVNRKNKTNNDGNSQIPANDNVHIHSYNGYDELHINRLGYSECDVTIYFFPTQVVPVFSLSKTLHDFILSSIGNTGVANMLQQATLAMVTRSIWVYAFKNRLFVESGDTETCMILDDKLMNLFNTNVDRIRISELPLLLQPHLYPPRPIKIVHKIKLTGKPSDNEQIVDLTLESCFPYSFKKPDINTEFDTQITALENEVIELLHLKNFYTCFSEDPHRFINNMMTNKNPHNSKPFTPDQLFNLKEGFDEHWVHYAMDNYMDCNNKSIQELVYKIFDKTPLSDFLTKK
ncbi:conserved hypothetical protein [Theileria equi strain WA]|uniref:Uncharacterized protein n=1 Tax=Theileria equi strain WA TaxID=1537102 RepID=L1LCZ8_THEEQ|nr:conserved hypothetical protein [Theileria equi strain WA]EKX73159.1 conserved hypothetical protein [Theileria equi strain WA]|eukprot:XP_004832611.1 conserved hypothetical protein [Theileria equi strain WA]